MGTDLHMAVERFDGTRWKWTGIKLNSDRNYDLFAILAGVRNGVGFAGVKTGEGFIPISEPRGFPDDVDPLSIRGSYPDGMPYDDDDESIWGTVADGDHSASWLLLSEILDSDLGRKTIKAGVMQEGDYLRYLQTGQPCNYCGSISGQNHVTLSEGEYALMRRGLNPRFKRDYAKHYSVLTKWEVDYSERIGYWLEDTKRKLLPLGDPAKTRIVFNFDS
jgi:hypothetical protein